MSFIDPRERLIIMDFGGAPPDVPANLLARDELRQIAGAGVKTIYLQGGFRWDRMQPTAADILDWSFLDWYIDNVEAAGLRALIPFVHTCPPWLGPDWFLGGFTTRSGTVPPAPNYANPQTARDLDNLLNAAIWRYAGSPVQFIFSIPIDGEFAFPLVPNRSEPDGFSNDEFIDWVVARQEIFQSQYGEVWTSYHMVDNPSWADALYYRLQAEFPKANHYALQFTHWYHSSALINDLDERACRHNLLYFCGSEYCQGIIAGAVGLAKGHNTGLLTSPIALHCGGGRLQKWQLDAIEMAVKELSPCS